MVDYEQPEADSQPENAAGSEDGPRLPGGVSLETAASALLVVVLVALLWLFFGPRTGSDEVPGLPTATATPADRAAGEAERAPVTTAEAGEPTGLARAGGSATPAEASMRSTPEAPSGIVEGAFVRVGGTEGMDLRYRFGPGTEYLTIRIAEDGEVMKVVGGPQVEDDLTWWRLQDTHGNVGWAVEDYIAPVAAPAAWNPPEASPTFQSQPGRD